MGNIYIQRKRNLQTNKLVQQTRSKQKKNTKDNNHTSKLLKRNMKTTDALDDNGFYINTRQCAYILCWTTWKEINR